MSPFAIPLPPTWTATRNEAPDVSATPQARLLGWDTFQPAESTAQATVGCFAFALSGYTDELAPIVFERTEPFAVRAAGGLAPASLQRQPWLTRGDERRQRLHFESPAGDDVHATLAFGFVDGELQTCFAICRGDADICTAAVDAAHFTAALSPPPPPSWSQAVALSVLSYPRATAGVAVGMLLAVIAALLLSRGTRAGFS